MRRAFSQKVYKIVQTIPKGKILTYGQVARLAGSPKAARAVGNILHKNPDPLKIPCHRVVSVDGRVAENFQFGGRVNQAKLLEKEGVKIENFKVPPKLIP